MSLNGLKFILDGSHGKRLESRSICCYMVNITIKNLILVFGGLIVKKKGIEDVNNCLEINCGRLLVLREDIRPC